MFDIVMCNIFANLLGMNLCLIIDLFYILLSTYVNLILYLT